MVKWGALSSECKTNQADFIDKWSWGESTLNEKPSAQIPAAFHQHEPFISHFIQP